MPGLPLMVEGLRSGSPLAEGLVGYWPPSMTRGELRLRELRSGETAAFAGLAAHTTDVDLQWAVSMTAGNSDYAQIAGGSVAALRSNFAASARFSVSAWVKTTNTSTHGCLLSKIKTSDSSYAGWFFSLLPDGGVTRVLLQFSSSASVYVYCYGDTQVADGAWHLVTATYDGSNSPSGITLYVDGVQDTTNSGSAGTVGTMTNAEPLRFGVRDPADGTTANRLHYTGLLGPVAVHARVLPAAQVRRLWSPGSRWDLLAERGWTPSKSLISLTTYTRRGIGGAATLNTFTRDGVGEYGLAPNTYTRRGIGGSTTLNTFARDGVGAAATLNTFGRSGVGESKVIYATYTRRGLGGAVTLNTFTRRASGGAATLNTFTRRASGAAATLASFTRRGRGGATWLNTFTRRGRGGHVVLKAFARLASGLHRVANAALDRYELFIGIDAAPDFTAAPSETFTSLPHSVALAPPVSGERTYHLVVRRRNAWNLATTNVSAQLVTIDADGLLVAPRPSSPVDVTITPAPSGAFTIQAAYLYGTDAATGADARQANQWLIYLRTNGTAPDPATDTPVVVTMRKADGTARLTYTTTTFAHGTPGKVVVRVRRSGTPNRDSRNVDVHTATATTAAPVTPSLGPAGGGAFIGHELRQEQ